MLSGPLPSSRLQPPTIASTSRSVRVVSRGSDGPSKDRWPLPGRAAAPRACRRGPATPCPPGTPTRERQRGTGTLQSGPGKSCRTRRSADGATVPRRECRASPRAWRRQDCPTPRPMHFPRTLRPERDRSGGKPGGKPAPAADIRGRTTPPAWCPRESATARSSGLPRQRPGRQAASRPFPRLMPAPRRTGPPSLQLRCSPCALPSSGGRCRGSRNRRRPRGRKPDRTGSNPTSPAIRPPGGLPGKPLRALRILSRFTSRKDRLHARLAECDKRQHREAPRRTRGSRPTRAALPARIRGLRPATPTCSLA